MKVSKKIIDFPEIMTYWDYKKNSSNPVLFSHGSHSKLWWKCKNGHSFQETPKNMIRRKVGRICQICSNEKNLLINKRTDLLNEWDYSLNNGNPETILFKSRKIVNWVCKNGHKWQDPLYVRSRGGNCPYCANKRASKDNNLLKRFTEIAKEWNYKKNDLKPEEVVFSSEKKYWWICNKGHEWKASIISRTCTKKMGNVGGHAGCPYCAGQKVCKDNCVATTNPELLCEWSKDNKITPNNVTKRSAKRIKWECKKGHKWETALASRTGDFPTGCPYCSKRIQLKDGIFFDSYPEAYLYLKLKSRFLKIEINKKYGFGRFRYDFYIPEINTYIETTSYSKNDLGYVNRIWDFYLNKIQKKRHYVENILNAKFRFIQINLNKSQKMRVKNSLR